MKVILAGMPKTGTTTMTAALNQLGFTVLDFFDHYKVYEKEWNKVMEEEWTTEDFRSMYKDIDVVANTPPCYFWKEIYKAFPNSKTVPKEKLLVFNVKQGWKPLCKFLDVDVPSTPFPHKNIKGSEVQDFIDNDPIYPHMQREMMVTTSMLIIIITVFFYWLFGAFG